jgi:hypothetical protein
LEEKQMTTTAVRKYWLGCNPTKCDFCKKPITDAFIDGNTRYGMWATMCPDCHSCHGMGLGAGRGQYYTLEADGKFYKVR